MNGLVQYFASSTLYLCVILALSRGVYQHVNICLMEQCPLIDTYSGFAIHRYTCTIYWKIRRYRHKIRPDACVQQVGNKLHFDLQVDIYVLVHMYLWDESGWQARTEDSATPTVSQLLLSDLLSNIFILLSNQNLFRLFLVSYWLKALIFPVCNGGGSSSRCKRKMASVEHSALQRQELVCMIKQVHQPSSYYI